MASLIRGFFRLFGLSVAEALWVAVVAALMIGTALLYTGVHLQIKSVTDRIEEILDSVDVQYTPPIEPFDEEAAVAAAVAELPLREASERTGRNPILRL